MNETQIRTNITSGPVSLSDRLFLGFRTQRVKRDPITKTPLSVRLSVCPSVTRLYLMNRDSQTVEIFTDDLGTSVPALTTKTKKQNKINMEAPIQQT
jgi:hypothetical protein